MRLQPISAVIFRGPLMVICGQPFMFKSIERSLSSVSTVKSIHLMLQMVLDLQRAYATLQKIQHYFTNDFIVDKDEGII